MVSWQAVISKLTTPRDDRPRLTQAACLRSVRITQRRCGGDRNRAEVSEPRIAGMGWPADAR